MSKESFIGGDYIETTGGDTKVYGESIFNSSATKFVQNGDDSGVFHGTNASAPDIPPGVATVTFAYFAIIEADLFKKIKGAGIGDEVYVVVGTTGLIGKTVEINIKGRDAILVSQEYGTIGFLQDNVDKKGIFSAKVGDDNLAIFKLELKPSEEEKDIKIWRDKINKTKDKIANLCILVDAEKQNPGIDVKYFGKNPVSDRSSKKGDKTNYWLDQKGSWFELRRKNPVIIIDPGHGDNNSKNSVYDPGAGINKEYEKDYALIISKSIKENLINKGYTVFMTRESDINVDPKGPLNWRYQYANEKKGDIFISIHLNSGSNKDVFSVYQQGKGNEIDSKSLANEIMENLKPVVVVPANNLRQVKGYTRFNTLAVLNNFNGKAGILIEFGGVENVENQKNIKTNKDKMGQAVTQGIINYVDKNF